MRVLVLGYGNPDRRDDGLGPRLAEALSLRALPGVDVESVCQLQAGDAAALAHHDVVVFVDADRSCSDPYQFGPVRPSSEPRLAAGALAPETLLSMAWKYLEAMPEAYSLAIRGEDFNGRGEGLSDRAQRNLSAALDFVERFLEERMSSLHKATTWSGDLQHKRPISRSAS